MSEKYSFKNTFFIVLLVPLFVSASSLQSASFKQVLKSNDLLALQSYLANNSSLATQKDSWGDTAFHDAALNGNPGVIKTVGDFFVAHGQKQQLGVANNYGLTAFDCAAWSGNPEAVKTVGQFFVDYGQKQQLGLANKNGKTAFDTLITWWEYKEDPFFCARYLLLCGVIPQKKTFENAPKALDCIKEHIQQSMIYVHPIDVLRRQLQLLRSENMPSKVDEEYRTSNGMFQDAVVKMLSLQSVDNLKQLQSTVHDFVKHEEMEIRKERQKASWCVGTGKVPSLQDLCWKRMGKKITSEKLIPYIPLDRLK